MSDSESITSTKESTVLTALPDVLIQDPNRGRIFFVIADELKKYANDKSSWASIGSNTVTFVIPDENYFEEVPPFSQSSTEAPDVLIQWAAGQTSFLLTYEQLGNYEVPENFEKGEGHYGISFIIPRGTELIEELPPLMAAMLQSGEHEVTVK